MQTTTQALQTQQRQTQQDWANREYIELIAGSIKRISDLRTRPKQLGKSAQEERWRQDREPQRGQRTFQKSTKRQPQVCRSLHEPGNSGSSLERRQGRGSQLPNSYQPSEVVS